MSINNDNIVKIGVALKWRNTFDLTKKYYQENVVTACGCVFRCKVLQAQGKSPIKMTDDQGHIIYTNTDVWDVLVDMAYYYNYAVDTRKLTQQMLDYAKRLDEAFQKQQKEIEALQKDNRDQWNHINDIEKVNADQQRELNSIFDTISCFSEGIWIDTLLWSNETIWDNNKYAITDDLQNQIDLLSETHRQDIKDLTDKHDSEISALTANIVRQNKIQDGINTYLQDQVYDLNTSFCCFGTGVWENDLHWSQEALWDNNKYAITDALAKDIKELDEHLSKSDQAFKDAMLANSREHGLVNTHLQKHDREINDLQILIQANHQLIENNTADIQENKEAIETTQSELQSTTDAIRKEALTEHRQVAYQLRAIGREQTAQDENIAKLGEHFGCFVDGVWGDLFLWNNDHLWHNASGVIEEALAGTNERIDEINEEIEAINQRAKEHQSEYQKMLDDIRAYNGCFEKGEWANPFFWNDTDVWYNTPNSISETENDIISHDNRLTALESQFALFIQQFAAQQTIIEQHQSQLETLMDCLTVLNVGRWQNLLLWDNTSKWSNVLITEASASVGTGGDSTVTVKSYDPDTATVTI